MHTPKISIIVPVYNVEHYLDECLSSIINQDEKNIEIIVINDMSPDNSEQIIDKYVQLDSRVRKINNPKNLGLGLTRNVGIKEAKGKYILFVDSDDFLRPNVLSALYHQAVENDLDILQANYIKVFSWDKNVQKKITIKELKGIYNGEMYLANRSYMPVVAWAKMWKTSFLKKNHLFFNEWYFEDVFYSSEAYFYANRIMESDLYIYNYRIRANSIMTTHINEKKLKSYMVLVETLEKHYLKRKANKDASQRLKLFAHALVELSGGILNYKFNNDLKNEAQLLLSQMVNKYSFEIVRASKLDILQRGLFFISPFLLYKIRKKLKK